MLLISDETAANFDESLLQTIADTLTDREVELLLCDDRRIRELNREYRGIDRPTDVLSFPLEAEHPQLPLGSIAISMDRVRSVARELGHSPDQELALLLIHGLLHLLGYDHEVDEGEMRREEEKLIRHFGLPESLIVRTEK